MAQASSGSEVLRNNTLLSDRPLDDLRRPQGGGRPPLVNQAAEGLSPPAGERHPSPPGAQQPDTEDGARKRHNPSQRVLVRAGTAQHDAHPAHHTFLFLFLVLRSLVRVSRRRCLDYYVILYGDSTMWSDFVACCSSFYGVSCFVKTLPLQEARRLG